jgi:thiol-disulfide isomerase/thioredoxin
MSKALLVAAVLAVGAAVGVGLQQASSGDDGASSQEALTTPAAEQSAQLAGAPPALAAIHANAGKLLPGGRKRLEAELDAVKGHPAVVNVWASWCTPCKQEAPSIQRSALSYGKRVAFLGVDLRDNEQAAKRFLGRYPVSFPSIQDPDGQIYNDYRLVGAPATIFYDASGKRTYLHQGAYRTIEDLDADIQRYALGAS